MCKKIDELGFVVEDRWSVGISKVKVRVEIRLGLRVSVRVRVSCRLVWGQ